MELSALKKIWFYLGLLSIVSFLFLDPLKMGDDEGNPTQNTPAGWFLFTAVFILLCSRIYISHKEWVNSHPKPNTNKINRYHYNDPRRGK